MNTPLRRTSVQRGTAVVLAMATTTVVPAFWSAAPAGAIARPALSSTALVDELAPLVNLRPSDMPAWQAHAVPAGAVSQQAASESASALADCAGAVPLAKLHFAAKMSDLFSRASGGEYVASLVAALGTPAQMTSILHAEQGKMLLQCLDKVIVPKMTRTLPAGAKVSVSHAYVPGMTAQSYGYRVRFEMTQGTAHVQIEDEVLGSVAGRAEVLLTFEALSGSVPTAFEARLLRTVTGRLEAHKALLG